MQAEHKFVIEGYSFGKKIHHQNSCQLSVVSCQLLIKTAQLKIVAGGWWLGTRGEDLSSTSHQPQFSEDTEETLLFPIGSEKTVLYLNLSRHQIDLEANIAIFRHKLMLNHVPKRLWHERCRYIAGYRNKLYI
jgi:hypothetical protein